VFILKRAKTFCFHALLQVLILRDLEVIIMLHEIHRSGYMKTNIEILAIHTEPAENKKRGSGSAASEFYETA
jgi:hypothetical protein